MAPLGWAVGPEERSVRPPSLLRRARRASIFHPDDSCGRCRHCTLRAMAIAHVCGQCGLDLSRQRARREPHYGLWLVTCPACGCSIPRQRSEITSGLLRFHRLHMALEALLLKSVVSAGLLGLAVVAAWGVAQVLPPRMGLRLEEVVGISFAALIVLPFVTGVWLTTAFTHLRRWKVWITWWSIPAALLVIGSLGYLAAPVKVYNVGDYGDSIEDAVSAIRWRRLRDVQSLLAVGLPACVVMGLAAWSGAPVGRLVNRVLSHARRWRWRWLRSRRRRLLQST